MDDCGWNQTARSRHGRGMRKEPKLRTTQPAGYELPQTARESDAIVLQLREPFHLLTSAVKRTWRRRDSSSDRRRFNRTSTISSTFRAIISRHYQVAAVLHCTLPRLSGRRPFPSPCHQVVSLAPSLPLSLSHQHGLLYLVISPTSSPLETAIPTREDVSTYATCTVPHE